jgi:hypothetical protein
MSYFPQWRVEKRGMRPGDLIFQRVFIPPVGSGLCLDFFVRVKEIVKTPLRMSFSYETLRGHVESGLAKFSLEQAEGCIIFAITTWSSPAHWLTTLAPKVTSLFQDWCTRRALSNMVARFCFDNPCPRLPTKSAT